MGNYRIYAEVTYQSIKGVATWMQGRNGGPQNTSFLLIKLENGHSLVLEKNEVCEETNNGNLTLLRPFTSADPQVEV